MKNQYFPLFLAAMALIPGTSAQTACDFTTDPLKTFKGKVDAELTEDCAFNYEDFQTAEIVCKCKKEYNSDALTFTEETDCTLGTSGKKFTDSLKDIKDKAAACTDGQPVKSKVKDCEDSDKAVEYKAEVDKIFAADKKKCEGATVAYDKPPMDKKVCGCSDIYEKYTELEAPNCKGKDMEYSWFKLKEKVLAAYAEQCPKEDAITVCTDKEKENIEKLEKNYFTKKLIESCESLTNEDIEIGKKPSSSKICKYKACKKAYIDNFEQKYPKCALAVGDEETVHAMKKKYLEEFLEQCKDIMETSGATKTFTGVLSGLIFIALSLKLQLS